MLSVFLYSNVFPAKRTTILDSNPHVLLLTPIFSLRVLTNPNPRLFTLSSLLQSPELSHEIGLPESNSKPKSPKIEDSFTVSYLINSCGLSQETAISVSEKVHFKTPERPDSVLTLLRNNGLNQEQITEIVRQRPSLLLSNPEKILLPKFEFFQSVGLSNTDLAIILSKDPTILTRSLENNIIPSYNLLKSVLLSNEKIAVATKRSWIFHSKNLAPNIGLLRELGVRQSKIMLLVAHFPEALIQKHDQFRETVIEVKKMGFDPLKSTFVLAVHALSGECNKSTWDQCYKTYSRWGWSKDDILSAFRKHPQCMILSEKKICRTMDFLLNKMGRWLSSDIIRNPRILFLSLETRIIPRCSVVHFLYLKGLLRKDVSLSTILQPAEKHFLERFVIKYEKEVPDLLQIYQGKVDVMEL